MVCIYCGQQLDVINSRRQKRSNQTWRRRQCPDCNAIFTSLESIDLSKTLVVKDKTGKLTPFTREKLLLSIYRCCRHRQNALHDAIALTETTLTKIIEINEHGLINNEQIAAVCMEVLHNFDKAAVVQYEAYHPRALN